MTTKSTGLIRRIDDLGRIVIPKEIRRTLRVREGDPMEILINGKGEVLLKKYSPVGELGDFAKQYAESLNESTGYICLITDRDAVIATSNGSKEYLDKLISDSVYNCMDRRRTAIFNITDKFQICENIKEEDSSCVIAPIIFMGDPIGSIIILSKDGIKMGQMEIKMAEIASGFLAKQMEV